MLTNLEMFRTVTANGFRIYRNEGDGNHNLIECDKDGVRIRLEWQDKQFSSISAKSCKASDIYKLQSIGVIKNIIATKKWICEKSDIDKLCKAVDIVNNAYAKIEKL